MTAPGPGSSRSRGTDSSRRSTSSPRTKRSCRAAKYHNGALTKATIAARPVTSRRNARRARSSDPLREQQGRGGPDRDRVDERGKDRLHAEPEQCPGRGGGQPLPAGRSGPHPIVEREQPRRRRTASRGCSGCRASPAYAAFDNVKCTNTAARGRERDVTGSRPSCCAVRAAARPIRHRADRDHDRDHVEVAVVAADAERDVVRDVFERPLGRDAVLVVACRRSEPLGSRGSA